MSETFDQELRLDDLLDATQIERIGRSLAPLLGGDCAISDGDGQLRWGQRAPQSLQQPVSLELEPVLILHSARADASQLKAAGELVSAILRAQARFRMASALHLEAVAADFEALKREHARVAESEARYRKLAKELDARVQAQVRQLEERQQMLYEAEKLASVGQLAAGMAHEINNPLGFVRSNLASFVRYLDSFDQLGQRLNEGPAAWRALDLDFVLDDSRELLRDCDQGLERIARIIADLKAFSNVDRATEEYTDLNACIRQAAAMIEAQLPAGVSLHLNLLPMPPMVCLPGHINQSLFNILRNAAQATADTGQGGEIHVASEARDDGLFIRIHDNGVGMSPEQREHAFEAFYTSRPIGTGVGLGLSTARSIVLAHSGQITLESQPGVGTTVTLSFPLPK